MRAYEFINEKEIINEGLSQVLYHYSELESAVKILQTGYFELSPALFTYDNINQRVNKGYMYYLSTTRSITGDFHRVSTAEASYRAGVMFNLDGRFYSQNHAGTQVDYFNDKNSDLERTRDGTNELEDRILSNKPRLSISGVTAIHILLGPGATNAYFRKAIKFIIELAKSKGIPAYFYTNRKHWLLQDTRHSQSDIVSRGEFKQDQPENDQNAVRNKNIMYFSGLCSKSAISELTPDEIELAIELISSKSKNRLAGWISELIKENNGPGGRYRPNVEVIYQYMLKNKLTDAIGLVVSIRNKWKSLKKSEFWKPAD